MGIETEQAIREIILDSVAAGVFTVDLEWKITSFNRAAEEITGVPREEAIGQRCCDVFRSSICETDCELRRAIESGKPMKNREIYIVNAAGEQVPVSITAAQLKDHKGRVIGGVETCRDLSEVAELRKELEGRYSFEDIISRNHRMHDLFRILPEVASSPSTVLIEGESGTGKELFARALHSLSPRKNKPFIAINCGALPDTLLESELFGYKAGAFTDARKDKPGRLAMADGGTIFLDEIGNISRAMQVRLLRVLQDRTYEPLGGTDSVKADVRVIAATNTSLAKAVEDGEFRRDLFYRVNVVRLEIPPLRDRKDDIPLLVENFIARFRRIRNKNITAVSHEVLAALLAHDYPGNVRELENVIEHAFVLCPSGLIELRHIPEPLGQTPNSHLALHQARGATTLDEMENIFITDALRRNKGNRLATARELGIHKSTLFRKIKNLGLSERSIKSPHDHRRN